MPLDSHDLGACSAVGDLFRLCFPLDRHRLRRMHLGMKKRGRPTGHEGYATDGFFVINGVTWVGGP